MRRALLLILSIFVFTATLSSCNNAIIDEKQKQTEISGSEAYEPKTLGSATFMADDTKSTSINYPANGTDATLRITDSNGLTWRLDIPKDALPQSQTIKMTAMRNVSVDTLGAMKGGVILEPDGLTFLEPAKLTVTGEGLSAKSLLLTGKKDGSSLSFTVCENKEGGVSADIFHFSTAVLPDAGEEAQMRDLADRANEHCNDAAKHANDILKHPIDEPPIPPDIALKCKKGTHDLDINKYYSQFLNELQEPEMSAVKELLGAERSKQLVGTSTNDDSLNNAAKLLDRLRTKVKRLIDKYQSQPDKFYATSTAFTQVERMYQLIGGKDTPDWALLQKWCENVTQYYLSELTDKHDYTAIHAAIRAARTLQLLGGDGDAYLQKLESALKFELKVETDMRTVAENYFSYNLTGTIPIQLTFGGDLVVGDGSGTCEYASAKSPIAKYVSPGSYTCKAEITKFDPCVEDVVKLSLDKFGAEEETWSYTLSGMTYADDSLSGWLAAKLFNTENSSLFDFSASLQNLNVNAVDQTLDKKATEDGLDLEGSIHLTLMHKPNS